MTPRVILQQKVNECRESRIRIYMTPLELNNNLYQVGREDALIAKNSLDDSWNSISAPA